MLVVESYIFQFQEQFCNGRGRENRFEQPDEHREEPMKIESHVFGISLHARLDQLVGMF